MVCYKHSVMIYFVFRTPALYNFHIRVNSITERRVIRLHPVATVNNSLALVDTYSPDVSFRFFMTHLFYSMTDSVYLP